MEVSSLALPSTESSIQKRGTSEEVKEEEMVLVKETVSEFGVKNVVASTELERKMLRGSVVDESTSKERFVRVSECGDAVMFI